MYKKVFTSLKIPNAESIKGKLLKHSFYFREKLIENFKLVFLGTMFLDLAPSEFPELFIQLTWNFHTLFLITLSTM